MPPPRPRRLKVTRYRLPDGQECRKDTPGAVRHREQTRAYYAWVGGKRYPLKTDDESEAWARLRELLRTLKAGAEPPPDAGTRPLPELLDEWLGVLRDKGDTEKQVATVGARLRRLFALAHWRLPADVTDDSLGRALAAMRLPSPDDPDGRVRERGYSPRTRNHYRTHARAFAAWLGDKLGRKLLTRAVRAAAVETDLRHERRCPSDAEIEKLFAALDGGPVAAPAKWTKPPWPARRRMSSRQRAAGYRVCLGTGLRAEELRSLRRESFALDAEPATVTVAASFSKRRRKDVIPLPPWLAGELRAWFAAGGATWEAFPADTPGRVLQADLKFAGVAYRTAEGFFDMHSLRVWYITQVATTPNIDPRHLMTLARHCTPALSLAVYAKARQERVNEIVGGLPRPGG